jgi:hypothetical protein
MKNTLSFLLATSLVSMAFAADSSKNPAPAEPSYDTATVINVSATVTAVREVPKGRALDGLHLTVQAGLQTLDVYVGPSEFIRIFEVTFAKGNEIHLIGSKVTFEDAPVVLAREISFKAITLVLRDKEGAPLWKFFLHPQG